MCATCVHSVHCRIEMRNKWLEPGNREFISCISFNHFIRCLIGIVTRRANRKNTSINKMKFARTENKASKMEKMRKIIFPPFYLLIRLHFAVVRRHSPQQSAHSQLNNTMCNRFGRYIFLRFIA